MNKEIEEIYKEISRDPDLFEQLIAGYLEKYPNSSKEEISSYIMKLISSEYSKEADEDKIRLQRDITRVRIVTKALNCLSDNSDIRTKKNQIRTAIAGVTSSSTGNEREELADLLEDCSTSTSLKTKKRKSASDEIGVEINNA